MRLKLFRSYKKKKFSNHPHYKIGGIKCTDMKQVDDAELCANCGFPLGEHYVNDENTWRCPTEKEMKETDFVRMMEE